MKTAKLILLIAFSTGIFSSYGQVPPKNDIQWSDWNTGYQLAKQEGKIIILNLYTDWCGWCKKMDKETFTNPEVVNLVSSEFVAIRLNPEKPEAIYYYKGKKVSAKQLLAILSKNQGDIKYPAILFIYPENDIVYSEEGFQKATVFKQLLKIHLSELQKITSRASNQ